MYSGWLLTNFSGALLGTHQKIDRVSRRHLGRLLTQADDREFPKVRQILRFEGVNGPDGVKKKSPGKDEPWHFYDPFNPDDTGLLKIIEQHYVQMVLEIKQKNKVRIAFEAAWLAHALVDGLTPAHHFPYEQELERLRGKGNHTRDTFKNKVYMQGDGGYDTLKKNWAFWGAKGLFTTHYMFEFGVSLVVVPLRLDMGAPQKTDIERLERIGVLEYFKQSAREIALMDLYETFYNTGWTPKLARRVREELAPILIKVVTLSWYAAVQQANKDLHQ